MLKLIPKTHSASGLQIVEVHDEQGSLVAGIYPLESGIKIISANFQGGEHPEAYVEVDPRLPVPSLNIPFGKPGPYEFVAGKLMKYGLG